MVVVELLIVLIVFSSFFYNALNSALPRIMRHVVTKNNVFKDWLYLVLIITHNKNP